MLEALSPEDIENVRSLADRQHVVEAMDRFYAEVDREVASRGPTCWNKGACCRFGEYGHRLYVTTLEVAHYLARGGMREETSLDPHDKPVGTALPVVEETHRTSVEREICPHAHDGVCHVRDRRPMGCRVYFCDPAAQAWQNPLSEALLGRLRQMHEMFDAPYLYVDWMVWMRTLRESSHPVHFRRATIDEIFPLRHELLRHGLPREEAHFEGDREDSTWHFAACDDQGRIVGCASFMESTWEGEPAWRLRGMAIARDLQGGGIGRDLLAHAEAELIRHHGMRLFWCNARIGAVGFYEKRGWNRASEVFDVPVAGPHCHMVKRITG